MLSRSRYDQGPDDLRLVHQALPRRPSHRGILDGLLQGFIQRERDRLEVFGSLRFEREFRATLLHPTRQDEPQSGRATQAPPNDVAAALRFLVQEALVLWAQLIRCDLQGTLRTSTSSAQLSTFSQVVQPIRKPIPRKVPRSLVRSQIGMLLRPLHSGSDEVPADGVMKSTSDLLQENEGLTRETVAYLVRLEAVRPVGRGPGRGRPFTFSDRDAELIRLIWAARREGFTWEAALARARERLLQPALLPEAQS